MKIFIDNTILIYQQVLPTDLLLMKIFLDNLTFKICKSIKFY